MAFVSGAAGVGVSAKSSRAACAQSARVSSRRSATVMMSDLQSKITAAMKEAEEASKKFGKTSKEAAVAWDMVEELEAEASHQKNAIGKKDPLEEFCDDVPEADECRTYDN
eukprot:CAMPEP_0185845584 /NCGR_PEP_ID=MMETSP1354-20130828/1506_1 /TAXON_ID=708628 /ORGANISM="Erythrolobus madagascarensis, Strain CCMP3276" /LENGTH=110 /DNA_ID=CAMNT_0028545575 /DNA_START=63 /DNA_END=395 /DNA_ORIENTATION=+